MAHVYSAIKQIMIMKVHEGTPELRTNTTGNQIHQIGFKRQNPLKCMVHGSCFTLFRTRTPFDPIVFHTMLQNPRMALDLIQRDSFLGIQHK